MQEPILCIGVDISKDELVIGTVTGRRSSIANNAPSIERWLEELAPHALIAMESTGRYHVLLAQLALQHGFKVYVLNARDVFFYARALGARAKTDTLDACVIARYLGEHHSRLHPWQAPSVALRRLHELLTRRAQVTAQRATLRQTFTDVQLEGDALSNLQDAFDGLLDCIDAQVQALIGSDLELSQGYERLLSIAGIGPQTGAMLATLFSRFQFANADALVAYAGLDPRPDDSGARRGRRRLSKKGPALLRRQMYLAAFGASHSKVLKPLYLAIRAKGFSTTASFVILGRKLLRVAYAIWKNGKAFDPSCLLPKGA